MSNSTLAKKSCEPCRGGVPPLEKEKIIELLDQLGNGWKEKNEHHIEKSYSFEDFQSALDFTNKVGAIAEKEGHHPDIHLSWGEVTLKIWTHKIDGLTESDFILAAKCDEVYG